MVHNANKSSTASAGAGASVKQPSALEPRAKFQAATEELVAGFGTSDRVGNGYADRTAAASGSVASSLASGSASNRTASESAYVRPGASGRR